MKYYDEELKKIRNYLLENPRGLTISEIAKKLDINRNSVAKYLDVLTISGQVEQKSIGPAKIYFLSQRVPLSTMLDFSSDYILVINKEMKIIQINDNFFGFLKNQTKNALGLSDVQKEDYIGRTIIESNNEFLSDDSFINNINASLKGKEIKDSITFETKDRTQNLEIKFIPTQFDDGDNGVTIILEEKKTKMTENQQDSVDIIQQKSSQGFVLINLDKIITHVNDSVSDILGYDKTELLSQDISILFNKDDKLKLFLNDLTKRPVDINVNLQKKDKSLIKSRILSDILFDRNNQSLYIACHFC